MRAGLFGCRRASAAVEFSILAWPFLALCSFILTISIGAIVSSSLQEALESGRRLVQSGSAGSLDADSFRRRFICPSLPVIFDCSQVWVNLRPVSADGYLFGAVDDVPDISTSVWCPPAADDDLTVLEAAFPLPALFIMLADRGSPARQGDRKLTVVRSATVFRAAPVLQIANGTGLPLPPSGSSC